MPIPIWHLIPSAEVSVAHRRVGLADRQDGKARSVSWASSPAIRRSMIGNRSRDTLPELKVRRILHAVGLRYRVNRRPVRNLRWTADIVFTRRRVAVFIDGCYWHGCRMHYVRPKTNTDYWSTKIAGNQSRDRNVDRALRQIGWVPLRFWEHDDPKLVASRIIDAVRAQSK